MRIAGIDYSMTSPAICIHDGETWDFSNCKFYYLSKNSKLVQICGSIEGSLYEDYETDQDRFSKLSTWALDLVGDCDCIAIENYAFGAVGRVFQIAENTGLLKQKLWEAKKDFSLFAPAEIKKFATGKGNAKKEAVVEQFSAETKIDLWEVLSIKNRNLWNPVSDIADSYFIAKYLFTRRFTITEK